MFYVHILSTPIDEMTTPGWRCDAGATDAQSWSADEIPGFNIH